MKDELRRVYRACFDFQEAHQPPADAPQEWWEQMARDVVAVADKLGRTPFAIDMLSVVIDQIQREGVAARGAGTDARTHDPAAKGPLSA